MIIAVVMKYLLCLLSCSVENCARVNSSTVTRLLALVFTGVLLKKKVQLFLVSMAK
jgi:hypothetical protein